MKYVFVLCAAIVAWRGDYSHSTTDLIAILLLIGFAVLDKLDDLHATLKARGADK